MRHYSISAMSTGRLLVFNQMTMLRAGFYKWSNAIHADDAATVSAS